MVSHRLFVVAAAAVLLAACSDSDKSPAPTTVRRTTTTSTSTSTTAPVKPATTGGGQPTTTQGSAAPDCSSRAILGGVSATQAPTVGVYRYLSCRSGAAAYTTTIGNGAAPSERTATWSASFGSVMAANSYGSAVTQATAMVRPKNATTSLSCTWDNPMVVYPAGLGMSSSWRTDGRCEMSFQQSVQFNRSSRVTGLRSFTVGGQSVRALLIEETTDVLYVDSPRRNSTSWHTESTVFFDPAHGLPVYERRISEATGQYPQAKTVTEVALASF